MVLKIFSIILFLSSLPSFATNTPLISEEDTDIKKSTQVGQILNTVINTDKLPEDITDDERKFLSGSSDNQKNSTSTKKDSVSKAVSPSKKNKKHVRKTSENLTFPEINSSKDDQNKSENFETQGEIKADTVSTSVPKKNKKLSKPVFGMTCFGKKSK